MNFRKCIVLREVEVPLSEIKAGDVYRLEKSTPEDPVSNSQWMLAEEDATDVQPPGNSCVKSTNVCLTPMAGAHQGIFRERA